MSDIKITKRMKADNNGEHTFTIDEPCPKCALHLDDHYDEVECLCDGCEERTYQKVLMVPWDTCKDIYRAMRESYERDIKPAKAGEYKHIDVGKSGHIGIKHEVASIGRVIEVSVSEGGMVEFMEANDYWFTRTLSKSKAIAALNELIHYIESSDDE